MNTAKNAASSSPTTVSGNKTTKILVPHDGSAASDKALDTAIQFAKALNAEIIILNVVDDRFVPPSYTLSFISNGSSLEEAKMKVIKLLKEAAEKMLTDRIEKVNQKNLKTKFILAVGSPSEEIIAIAKSEGVGLIIIGSRQLEGKDKIKSLGSVSRRVSETAQCPVMIVH